MIANYHTHSTWCDGKNTPEEMILAAIAKGFGELGFSSHAMLSADPFDWTVGKDKLPHYMAEIRALAEKYRARLKVLCGVEADYVKDACSPDRSVYPGVDYIIGSVHYVVAPDGSWVCVDESPESLVSGIREHFNGSVEAFAHAYFAAQREMASLYDFDIVGHPDLLRKFNAQTGYLDETSSWYNEELERTADAFAASGKIVEVNTGGISRGWIDDAYPSARFKEMLFSRGVPLLLSSDAHSVDGIDCAFDRFADSRFLPALALER